MTHSFISIAAPLPRAQEQAATALLDALGNPLKKPLSDKIEALACLHFFSMTIVPGDEDMLPHLVFELSADGGERSVLETLAAAAKEELEPVFALAEGYDSAAGLAAFWLSRTVHTGCGYFDTPGVAHTGTPGMSVTRIHKEAALAAAASDIFMKTPRGGTALDVLNRVRDALRADPANEWAFAAEPAPLLEGGQPGGLIAAALKKWPDFIRTFLWPFLLAAFILSALGVFPAAALSGKSMMAALMETLVMSVGLGALLSLGFAGYIYVTLRRLEESDVPDDTSPAHARLDAVMAREDHAYQNHLAGVSVMKGGMVRQITIRLIFWLIGVLAGTYYRPGFLGSIGTIHFARWFMLPGTDRLLFFSNFGGSWESYLEDFITKANFGLTGVWSNTEGFPKTTNLVFDGARDGDRFKRWARRQQNPTWCWYSAYPHLTTARIRTNAAIRQGLAGIATETAAQDWLTLFGSAPLPRTELSSHNIQAILFGGFGPLPHACCLALGLPDDPAAARAWLGDAAQRLTFGDSRPVNGQCARIAALSASGLRRLGLGENDMANFPHAFSTGMAGRARILGDSAESAPEKWNWGGPKVPVDAALMIYAPDAATLAATIERESEALTKNGGRIIHALPLKELPPRGTPFRENFGFVDGVSQPVIRGIGKHRSGTNPLHILEPGEFILGYPDGLGTYPQTPSVPAIADPANDLHAVPASWAGQRPDFSHALANAARDLGRDGSYMVIRQLEQDVDGFHAFTKKAAKDLAKGSCPLSVDPEWVGAKMIGRWQDGSSLVRNPDAPATAAKTDARPDNNFLPGTEDPQGLRCPYGSHIRRTNPRESFEPGSMEQLAIVNRHRILRAGRLYEEEGGKKKGLLFVCLNADIERQFEFIQQTWIEAPAFHGLDGEVDPVFSDRGRDAKYTIPMPDGARTISGLKSFVTTRGGEYFFLPGRQALAFLSRER